MQHRLCVLCIYKTLIQQRLLVEFSCKLPTRYPTLRDLLFVLLLVLVTNSCYNSRTQPTFKDSVFCRLLSLILSSLSTVSRALNIKKTQPDPRHKGIHQSGKQSLTGHLHTCPHIQFGHITLYKHGRQSYSCRRLMLQDLFVTCSHRIVVSSIKEHLV